MRNEFKSMFQETVAEESGGFSLIETGEYEAELTDCKLDMTKDVARLSLVYTITQDPYVGRKQFGNYQLEGRGIGFLKKDLATLGLDYSQIGSPEDIATLIWDAMPVNVVIFVNQKEWQGKIYNNAYLNSVADVPAHKTAMKPAVTKPQAAKTTSRPPAKARTKPTQPISDEPDFGDDEIPF